MSIVRTLTGAAGLFLSVLPASGGSFTVNTLPDATLEAFEDHGTVARTIDLDPAGAQRTLDRLAEIGIDMDDVAAVLEREGVASFAASFDDLIATLTDSAERLRG